MYEYSEKLIILSEYYCFLIQNQCQYLVHLAVLVLCFFVACRDQGHAINKAQHAGYLFILFFFTKPLLFNFLFVTPVFVSMAHLSRSARHFTIIFCAVFLQVQILHWHFKNIYLATYKVWNCQFNANYIITL